MHLDRFHLGDEFELATQAVTWAWIAIYVAVPVLMAVLWVVQSRVPGTDPPRSRELPGWLRAVVAIQAVGLLALGAYLLVDPLAAAELWPWPLTPLTGRATGAWLFSLGVAAGHALVERDVRRLRPAALAYLTFGVLQGVALARYPEVPDWGSAELVGYVAFLVSAVVVGTVTTWLARQAPAPVGPGGAPPATSGRVEGR
jgi:hypothetical protein